jgi:hypothetical protein
MKFMAEATSLSGASAAGKAGLERSAPAYAGQKPARPAPGLLRRLIGRKEPSTYQRCLAVHVYYAGRRGALSDG